MNKSINKIQEPEVKSLLLAFYSQEANIQDFDRKQFVSYLCALCRRNEYHETLNILTNEIFLETAKEFPNLAKREKKYPSFTAKDNVFANKNTEFKSTVTDFNPPCETC